MLRELRPLVRDAHAVDNVHVSVGRIARGNGAGRGQFSQWEMEPRRPDRVAVSSLEHFLARWEGNQRSAEWRYQVISPFPSPVSIPDGEKLVKLA